MAIDNFTQAEFEKALPKNLATGEPLWTSAGFDQQTGQVLYTVKPFTGGDFAILVFSSIQVNGASTAKAGKDSIRAVITYKEKPWGGKTDRWIDRRKGWEDRLDNGIRRLVNQIKWLRLPCPSCGSVLVPFTCQRPKKIEDKKRPFVCCKNDKCGKAFWAWTQEQKYQDEKGKWIEGDMILPPTTATPAQAPAVQQHKDGIKVPKCHKCNAVMKRMGSGKGWRCSMGSAFKDGGTWVTTGCDGVKWDNPRTETPVVNQPQSQPVKMYRPTIDPASRAKLNLLLEKIEAHVVYLTEEAPASAMRDGQEMATLLKDLLAK